MRSDPQVSRGALARVRSAINGIDDGLLLLLAARHRLVRRASQLKSAAQLPGRDGERERYVHARAQSLARRIGLPAQTAREAMAVAIADAHRQQRLAPDLDQGHAASADGIIAPMQAEGFTQSMGARRWLRLLPPPARLARVVAALPASVQRRWLERAMAQVLHGAIASGALEFMRGRRLGIDVVDLPLRWVIGVRGDRLCVLDESPEASVRGTATDLLLLASRLEDADTLFFQRRLVLTGDTELGLTARNLLDRLPWSSMPLALRIGLNRAARLARAARAAHRGQA